MVITQGPLLIVVMKLVSCNVFKDGVHISNTWWKNVVDSSQTKVLMCSLITSIKNDLNLATVCYFNSVCKIKVVTKTSLLRNPAGFPSSLTLQWIWVSKQTTVSTLLKQNAAAGSSFWSFLIDGCPSFNETRQDFHLLRNEAAAVVVLIVLQ